MLFTGLNNPTDHTTICDRNYTIVESSSRQISSQYVACFIISAMLDRSNPNAKSVVDK